jgi:hypothetical protein
MVESLPAFLAERSASSHVAAASHAQNITAAPSAEEVRRPQSGDSDNNNDDDNNNNGGGGAADDTLDVRLSALCSRQVDVLFALRDLENRIAALSHVSEKDG